MGSAPYHDDLTFEEAQAKLKGWCEAPDATTFTLDATDGGVDITVTCIGSYRDEELGFYLIGAVHPHEGEPDYTHVVLQIMEAATAEASRFLTVTDSIFDDVIERWLSSEEETDDD